MRTVFLERKDLPDWVRQILKDRKMAPSAVAVHIGETADLPGSWHDANCPSLYFHDRSTQKVVCIDGAFGGSSPFHDKLESAVNSGGRVPLDRRADMILHINTYPKTAKLFAHPDSVVGILPDTPDISWAERVVLIATRSLKSSYGGVRDYRRNEAMRGTGIDAYAYDKAKEDCIRKGYLNKRGAITAKGRTIAGTDQLHQVRSIACD